MIQIVPAILATSEKEFKDKIEVIKKAEALKDGWVQIDLMDNKFVQNKSIASEVVKKYPLREYKVEAHLMVSDPYKWVSELKNLEIDRFIAPVELKETVLDKFYDFTKGYAKTEIGFSLNPETSTESLGKYLKIAKSVLIMSVHPGFGGQEFIPETLAKIEEISRLRLENDLEFLIGVDGGINRENVKSVVAAGIDYVVIGSSLLKGDIDENLDQIWEAVYG